MADIADNGAVFHLAHMVKRDDVHIAGGGDENIASRGGVFHRGHLIALHGRLQCTNRVNFRHHHTCALRPQAFGRAFADIAKPANHSDFTRHHHIRGAFHAVNKTFATAIKIVEFRFGHAIIYIDCGDFQRAVLCHFVKAQHTRCGFFRYADALVQHFGIFFMRQLGQVAAII